MLKRLPTPRLLPTPAVVTGQYYKAVATAMFVKLSGHMRLVVGKMQGAECGMRGRSRPGPCARAKRSKRTASRYL